MNPNDLFVPLSFIGGPAILMNACAVMQNGASVRYSLAINLWREMRAEASGGNGTLLMSYANPSKAMVLATRRIRLLLVALNLLYVTVALFGVATASGLVGSYAQLADQESATGFVVVVVGAASCATCGLLAAMVVFVVESRMTQRLIILQSHSPQLERFVGAQPGPPGTSRG